MPGRTAMGRACGTWFVLAIYLVAIYEGVDTAARWATHGFADLPPFPLVPAELSDFVWTALIGDVVRIAV